MHTNDQERNAMNQLSSSKKTRVISPNKNITQTSFLCIIYFFCVTKIYITNLLLLYALYANTYI